MTRPEFPVAGSQTVVQSVSIASAQHDEAQAAQLLDSENCAHKRFASPRPRNCGSTKNIGQVSEGGTIGDDASEGNLLLAAIDSKAQGMRMDAPPLRGSGPAPSRIR